jgi:hypothetical protein
MSTYENTKNKRHSEAEGYTNSLINDDTLTSNLHLLTILSLDKKSKYH